MTFLCAPKLWCTVVRSLYLRKMRQLSCPPLKFGPRKCVEFFTSRSASMPKVLIRDWVQAELEITTQTFGLP